MRLVVATIICFCCLNAGAQSWAPATGHFSQSVSFLIEDTLQNLLYVIGQFGYHEDEHVGGFCAFDGQNVISYGCGFDCTLPFGELISGAAAAAIYHDTLYITRSSEEIFDTLTNNVPSTRGIAKFFNGEWYTVSDLAYGNTLYGLAVVGNSLYAAGYDYSPILGFDGYGGVNFNGTNWSGWQLPITSDASNFITRIVEFEDQIHIAGNFGGWDCFADISYWNGIYWECAGNGLLDAGWGGVYDMIVYNNELYIGGIFERAAGNPGEGIMKWNGEEWSDVGYGLTNGEVHDMEVHNGELYICGQFDEVGNIPAHNFAKWDGHNWCGLDASFGNIYNRKFAFYNDTLYAVATTDSCANCLYKWNGYVDTCSVDFNAVQEQISPSSFQFYPNPADVKVTLQFKSTQTKDFTIQITNTLGQVMLQEPMPVSSFNQHQIDVSSLASGIYIVSARSKNRFIFTQKFIVQHNH